MYQKHSAVERGFLLFMHLVFTKYYTYQAISPDRKALGLKFAQRLPNAVVAQRLPRDNGSYLNKNYNNVIISLSSCFGAS